MSDQELEALLAAASKDCTEKCRGTACFVQPCGRHCDYPYTDEGLPACRACDAQDAAKRDLAALAPALAQELIERRRVGGGLTEAMQEYERMWESANDCPECVGSLCADHALQLILARTKAKDAADRWAELQPGALLPTAETEEEVRDDLIDSACRCCGVGIQVVPEDAVDLCLACLQGKGGDTNAPCKACKEPHDEQA